MRLKPLTTSQVIFGVFLILFISGYFAKSQSNSKGASELNPQQSLVYKVPKPLLLAFQTI